MTTRVRVSAVFLAAALLTVAASGAHAQPRVEIGASLVNSVIGLGNNNVSTVGIPSGGFGVLNPGAYASFFLGERVALEPQIGLIWASFDGDSAYILNFVGQVDYFVRETGGSSPYLFATAGLVSQTDAGYTPKSLGVGAGYRFRVGDRLSFRLDGRYTHFTGEFEGDASDALAFTFSIGGIFGH